MQGILTPTEVWCFIHVGYPHSQLASRCRLSGVAGEPCDWILEWLHTLEVMTFHSDPPPLATFSWSPSAGPRPEEGLVFPFMQVVDNVTAHAFTKADFITYYESTVTRRPVHWFFHASSGQPAQFDVMFWEDGGKAAEAECQAPAYCFTGNGSGEHYEENGRLKMPHTALRHVRSLRGWEANV